MTPYDLLRTRINELLPDHAPKCVRCEKIVPIKSDFCRDGLAHIIEHRPLTITDVLRALRCVKPSNATLVHLEASGCLIFKDRWEDETWKSILFNLAAPLSDPSNAAACEAVLGLLDSKKE